MENDQLMHYGILGMKWGIRRYQNKDGSLTEEGKLRYGKTSFSGHLDESTTKAMTKLGFLSDRGLITEKGHKWEVDRRKKLSPEEGEKELREFAKQWTANPEMFDDEEFDDYIAPMVRFQNEVGRFLYDSYAGNVHVLSLQKPVSELRDIHAKLGDDSLPWNSPERKKLNEQIKQKNDELASIMLRELGYADTKKARVYFKTCALYDCWNDYGSIEEIDEELSHSDSTSPVLSHHGIKDQKWGVRRFQNPDGSLTALGRLRYGVGKERSGAGEEDSPKTDGHSGGEQKKAAALKSVKKEAKSACQMDEDELLKRIGRLEREKRYSDLVVEQKKRETGTMERLLKEAGTDFLKQSLSKVVSKTVARIFDKNEGDFKIEKYQDKDTGKLDLGTLQKIKKWYETAGDVENKRDAYNHRGAPDDKTDFSRLSAKSLNTVKEWYESARAAEKARDSYEHRNDPPKEKKKKEQ